METESSRVVSITTFVVMLKLVLNLSNTTHLYYPHLFCSFTMNQFQSMLCWLFDHCQDSANETVGIMPFELLEGFYCEKSAGGFDFIDNTLTAIEKAAKYGDMKNLSGKVVSMI